MLLSHGTLDPVVKYEGGSLAHFHVTLRALSNYPGAARDLALPGARLARRPVPLDDS